MNKFMLLLLIALVGCSSQSVFNFTKNDEGIELLENGKPVFFYQQKTKLNKLKHPANNYIHPLYCLNGDALTEAFPKDHPHHRGIFWAWTQVYSDTVNIANSWALENFTNKISDVEYNITDSTAVLKTTVFWESPLYKNSTPFVKEKATITTYKSNSNSRIIDFEISLLALAPKISIGGSNNEKGYGGFSLRLHKNKNLIFTSEKGIVKPKKLQIKAGGWMDFSADFGKKNEICGVTLLCDSNNPNYPQPWILRQEKSMQNVVFPGRDRVLLSTEKSLVLKYRLVVHKDGVKNK